jgi:hypothetical protein
MIIRRLTYTLATPASTWKETGRDARIYKDTVTHRAVPLIDSIVDSA